MVDLKRNTLLREMPENLLVDDKVVRLANSLQASLDQMLGWVDKINYTTNLDDLPDEIIDHLLWEGHIGHDEGLVLANTRQQKINLIRNSVELHRIKGTPYAIELVLQTVGLKGEVVEWFEYGGDPYTFKILLSASSHIDLVSGNLKDLINSFKNVRSHFEHFEIKVFDIVVVLGLTAYDFPVPYPITNTFRTADVKGGLAKMPYILREKAYAFEALYPITNTFFTSPIAYENVVNNVVLTEEYRNNDILYKRAGTIYAGEGDI